MRAAKNLRGVAMLYVGALTFLGVMLSAGPASAGIITLGQNANNNLCFGNGGHIAIEVSISNGNNSGCGQALSGGTHEISGSLSGTFGTGTYHLAPIFFPSSPVIFSLINPVSCGGTTCTDFSVSPSADQFNVTFDFTSGPDWLGTLQFLSFHQTLNLQSGNATTSAQGRFTFSAPPTAGGPYTVPVSFDIAVNNNSSLLGLFNLARNSNPPQTATNNWAGFSAQRITGATITTLITLETNGSLPEPGTLILLGSGVLGLAAARRWRQAKA